MQNCGWKIIAQLRTKVFSPSVLEDDRFNDEFETTEGVRELKGRVASFDQLLPQGTVLRPVGMQHVARHLLLHLQQTLTDRRQDGVARSEHGSAPTQLARRRQTETPSTLKFQLSCFIGIQFELCRLAT